MGTVFLRALQMIIMPLVFSSIISGVTNIGNAGNLGRLGLKTLIYYLSTSILAIMTGLILVNIVRPGVGADLNLRQEAELNITGHSFKDTLIHLIPDNIFSSMTQNGEMLAVILFALLFGFFITRVAPKPRTQLTGFFNAVFDVMMKVTLFIIRFTPFCIFGLVAEKVARQSDLMALVRTCGCAHGAGLVMITIILTAVGLPLEGVGLILAVDRIPDMFRTATNVWSNSCGAVVIAKTEGESLKV